MSRKCDCAESVGLRCSIPYCTAETQHSFKVMLRWNVLVSEEARALWHSAALWIIFSMDQLCNVLRSISHHLILDSSLQAMHRIPSRLRPPISTQSLSTETPINITLTPINLILSIDHYRWTHQNRLSNHRFHSRNLLPSRQVDRSRRCRNSTEATTS